MSVTLNAVVFQDDADEEHGNILQAKANTAATAWKAGQIQTRRIGGNDVIDLEGIPMEKAKEILETVAKALRH